MLTLLFALLSAVALRTASAATVFAHFMLQNSYAYDQDQWESDMTTAKDIGIDGFALNWIPPNCAGDESWAVDRIDDAFTAAENVGFKLMYSFDMSYSECDIYWNQTFMQEMITKYAGSSATYRWNSNILVSTYGGDMVDQYGDEFFAGLKANMKYWNNAITLAPALTKYSMAAQTGASSAASKLISDYSSIDGYLNWQAWPLDVDKNMTSSPDKAFQSALKNAGRTGPYIMCKLCKGSLKTSEQVADTSGSHVPMAVQGPQRRQPARLLGSLQRYPLPSAFRSHHERRPGPA